MRIAFKFLVARGGVLLLALGLVDLAGCNHDDGRSFIPERCHVAASDLNGTWELTTPAPDAVSVLSSCTDPSLDGTPVEFNPLCVGPLPCAIFMTFEVSAVQQSPGGQFVLEGIGSGGRDRLLGSITPSTGCGAYLTILQADNSVHLLCSGFLDRLAHAIFLTCGAADVERTPGDDLLVSCEVHPPIEGQITITPTIVLE